MKSETEIFDIINQFEGGDYSRSGNETDRNCLQIWRYPRFFVTEISKGRSKDGTVPDTEYVCRRSEKYGTAFLSKDDTAHAAALRIRDGDLAIICDGNGTDYLARMYGNTAYLLSKRANRAEPSVNFHLFMSALKSDKNEFVVQKAVELGASTIVPVLTKNCVAVPELKSRARKTERYRRIACEAAKQCGRGIIPKVGNYTDFAAAVEVAGVGANCIKSEKMGILFYEAEALTVQSSKQVPAAAACKVDGLRSIVPLLERADLRDVFVFIGSEGGYTESEVAYAMQNGFHIINLGQRVLRADTAPVTVLSLLSYLTKNM